MKNLKYQYLFNFLKSNENTLSFLFIILFSSIITLLLIWINSSQEILGHSYRDVYFYLIGALRFSGYSIGGYEYINYLSPLIPFLTSLIFRMGFISETSIFIVTGVFYVFGVFGVFSLLKLRFKNLMALLGAVIYGGFSINLIWVANGTIDIPSISLTILSIYFFVIAIEKNQKYFYLAFPLAILGFFAKYTAGLAIPLMLVYILSKGNLTFNIRKYLKNGIGGLLVGIITTLPFLANFYFNNIPLGFLNQAQNIASRTTTATNLNNDLFFYIANIPRFIYNPNHILSYIIIAIIIIGLLLGLLKAIKLLKSSYNISNKFKVCKIKIFNRDIPNKIFYLLLFLNIVIIALAFLTVSKISFIYSELIFFALTITFSFLITKIIRASDYTKKFFSFDILMFAWFFSYLIFFSAHLIKADRYFMTMAPGFAFMIILALNFILNSFDSVNLSISKSKSIKSSNLIKNIIPIALIILFIISSFAYLTLNKHDSLVSDERNVSVWLKNHDPYYETKIIWAERGPIFTWYLKKEVNYVNWAYSPDELSEMMIADNVTYFISVKPEMNTYLMDIPGFFVVKKIGKVIVYQRNLG